MRPVLFRFLLASFLGLASTRASEVPVPESAQSLTEKYEAAMAPLDVPLHELRDAYLTRVEELKNEIQEQGDLELVLTLTREMESIIKGAEPEKGSPLPEHEALQRVYHNRKAELVPDVLAQKQKLEKAYLDRISMLVETHTKSGDLETALALRKLEEASAARLQKWTAPGASYSVGRMLFTDVDWTTLTEKVKKGELQKTSRVGGNAGRNETTRDVPDPPAILVGFDLHMAPFGGSPHTVRKMVPLFRSQAKPVFEGSPRANANGQSTERVLAKNGYALTGITTHSGAGVRKVKFTFSRITGVKTSSDDSYETEFYGEWEDGRVATLSTEGRLAVGLDGWVGLGTGEFWLLTID